jgi:hypothetical protein
MQAASGPITSEKGQQYQRLGRVLMAYLAAISVQWYTAFVVPALTKAKRPQDWTPGAVSGT